MVKFTGETKIVEILKTDKGPELLAKFGVPCPQCPSFAAEAEQLTIGDVCKGYGLDVKKLLAELNK